MPFNNVIRLPALYAVRSPPNRASSDSLVAANDARLCHRFSVRDRIFAHGWISSASEGGYGRMEFAVSEDSDGLDPCEYMLIYRRDTQWAQWGVACGLDGYEVWHATRGTTLGVYAKLTEALAQLLSHAE